VIYIYQRVEPGPYKSFRFTQLVLYGEECEKIIEKEDERDFNLMNTLNEALKLQTSTYSPFNILQLVSLHPICQIRNAQ
jgi:hypothetical protein